MPTNPIRSFAVWLKAASRSKAIVDATAGCLATIGRNGFPEGRMVLLKEFDERGFVFYTNLRSNKGRALARHPRAALTFHWAPLERQIRIQGTTARVSAQEADAYWQTRPRMTQLGAWASRQSERLPSREHLLKEVARLAKEFSGKPVPRPSHWTGIRILPRQIEFWQGRASRLHDRFLYKRMGRRWIQARLYP